MGDVLTAEQQAKYVRKSQSLRRSTHIRAIFTAVPPPMLMPSRKTGTRPSAKEESALPCVFEDCRKAEDYLRVSSRGVT